jgi:hypothetical protein
MLGYKDHKNQLFNKKIAGLRREKLKLKEQVGTMWRDYEKYKTQHEGILRSLEKEREVLLSRLSHQDPDLRRAKLAEKEGRTTLETQHEALRSQLYCKEERANQLQSLVDQLQTYPEPRSCAREGLVIT